MQAAEKEEQVLQQETLDIREVVLSVEQVYFVSLSRSQETEQTWEDEEAIFEVAREIEREERQERVAKSRRRFWAKDFILEHLWSKLRERQEVQKWAKQLILSRLEKVIRCRVITTSLIEKSIDEVDQKEKVARATVKKKKF